MSRPAPNLSAKMVADLLDSVGDPRQLRRKLARLAVLVPELSVPEPGTALQDLREALRRAQGGLEELSPSAARRYQVVDLLLQGVPVVRVAERIHASSRTTYRARLEAVEELLPHLEHAWGVQSPAAEAAGAGAPAVPERDPIPIASWMVGREADLQSAVERLRTNRLLVLGGPPGIGKSALAALIARHEQRTRPVLWHQVRAGITDSVGGVLVCIGQRLAQLNSGALLAFMREARGGSPWQAIAHDIAVQGVERERLTMIWDAAETIADNAEVCGLLTALVDDAPEARILLVSRQRMPYAPDAAWTELSGLQAEEVGEYLALSGVDSLRAQTVATLTEQTGGNPQLLRLAVAALRHGRLSAQALEEHLLDVPDVQVFFFDHVYHQLTPAKQLVLGAASLVRRPESGSFLAAALEGLVPSIPNTLSELGRRYLLSHEMDGLRLHTTVRQLARQVLAPRDRERLHRQLARAYERAGSFDEACHHFLEAGDLDEARRLFLANPADGPPHAQAQLRALLARLFAAGYSDDAALAEFATKLDGHAS